MTKVIIIDDEPLARAIVKEYLATYPEMEVVTECGDGFEGVKAIAQYKPDLVFLDVQMPKINGFEMLELLDETPFLIFTTAFDEYAIRAFEENAVDYLLKPFSRERFHRAVAKWRQQVGQLPSNDQMKRVAELGSRNSDENQRIVVKSNNTIKIIPTHEIHYIEAFDDYVKVHTSEGFYLKKKTMSAYEKILDTSKFVRTHRSFMINLQELNKLEPFDKEGYMAVLKSGVRIPVSKSGYPRLREALDL